MNTLDGKLLVDRGRFLLYETQRAVVPFIINITMEINFSSKVYSKSLLKVGPLKGSPCLLPIVSRKLSPFLHQILVNM